ncbi:hypothetical protein BUALT_Bualt02G0160600 [Buddleja alternifolia]|uniref:Uncharacterized protein n=1 Tax=Buddleja alternifolia TaxID=168488 RepID=A0AAV6YBC4_9LAMI|nr:hypothetical protein BUALT_Bualt02G0160600 [Buddleja alternifolia]
MCQYNKAIFGILQAKEIMLIHSHLVCIFSDLTLRWSRSVPLKVIRGPLVDEVHQQFSSWIYQITRVYKDKEHAEVEFTIGPVPTKDSVGKEFITRLTANMATDKVFFTDSNGRDFLKRMGVGSVLVRLAHLYEGGEDKDYSTLAKVELKKMFAGIKINVVKEMSLSANQETPEMKRMMNWAVKGESGSEAEAAPIRGDPVDMSTLNVELGPIEIRTFILTF